MTICYHQWCIIMFFLQWVSGAQPGKSRSCEERDAACLEEVSAESVSRRTARQLYREGGGRRTHPL